MDGTKEAALNVIVANENISDRFGQTVEKNSNNTVDHNISRQEQVTLQLPKIV